MFHEILAPSFVKTGIIISILNEAALGPNVPNNYRSITLSCTHGNLAEFLILAQVQPTHISSDTEKARAHLWPVHLSILCCNIVA